MSVDFNGINQNQINTQRPTTDKAGSATKTVTAERATAQSTQARGESVSLSSQARDLKQLEQKLGDFPEMDDEKISQIRSALEDGSYKVDAQKLAQKMLDMDKSVFG
jgi:negative regulator of flagellin synthesis FlgM